MVDILRTLVTTIMIVVCGGDHLRYERLPAENSITQLVSPDSVESFCELIDNIPPVLDVPPDTN